jgi:transcriptional regulator with XRE-family HTH domain
MSRSFDPTVGFLVLEARKKLGWTQDRLAEEVEMSQRWVSDLERDVVALPRPRVLASLSQKLGIPLADLYIAGRVARTKEEAERVIAENERIDLDTNDPLYSAVFLELRKLSPDDLSAVREIIRRMTRDQPGGS